MRAELTSPKDGSAPTRIPLERSGPGHYVNTATQFDTTGLWSLEVRAAGTSSGSRDDVAEIRVAVG